MMALESQPYPTGMANLIDLTFFSDFSTYRVCYYVFCGALLLYGLGLFLPLALPVAASLHIGMLTLYNSQGANPSRLSIGVADSFGAMGCVLDSLGAAYIQTRTVAPSRWAEMA